MGSVNGEENSLGPCYHTASSFCASEPGQLDRGAGCGEEDAVDVVPDFWGKFQELMETGSLRLLCSLGLDIGYCNPCVFGIGQVDGIVGILVVSEVAVLVERCLELSG